MRDDLANLLKENKSEKEIEKAAYEINPNLVKTIEDNSNLKIILNKKLNSKKPNKPLEKKNRKEKKSSSKKLFNNPFDQLKDINAK